MKFLRKIFAATLMILIFIMSSGVFNASASYKIPFAVNSQVVYMVNLDTNTVVFEQNAEQRMYPASLTKIMTAVIALETIADLEGTIVKSPAYLYDEFVGLNVSNADIKKHEEVRMIDLLYAMMLNSACEASSIIADYIGGGNITEFVEMMNQKAQALGATDTVFKNPHGLFHEEQVTTAKDLYLITKHALEIPMFEKIVTTPSYEMPTTNKHSATRYVVHTNFMMSKSRGGDLYYEPIKGIKTGSLPEVGKNLISMAEKDGYHYLLITMGAPEKDAEGNKLPQNGAFVDAKALYQWAFGNFTQQTIVKTNEVVDETNVKLCSEQDYITLLAKDDVYALLPSDSDPSTIQRVKTIEKDVRAPIKKGTILGKMDLKLNDDVIATVDLVASQDLDRSPFLYGLDVVKRFLQNSLVQVLLIILVILILLYIIIRARYRKIKRMNAARTRNLMRHGK